MGNYMNADYWLVFGAKMMVVVTLVVVLSSALIAFVEFRKSTDVKKRVHIKKGSGSVASFVVILTCLVFFGYREAQEERKSLLSELHGISAKIDDKIESSMTKRVSYFHTRQIVETALVECRQQESSSDGAEMSGPCRNLVSMRDGAKN